VETFTVRDEHYIMAFEGSPAEVFLHSRSEHGVQPAGWTRNADGGRVCVLTPGHNEEVWRHPSFQKLLSNSLCWAAKTN
jgi:type 1 glutamine amidotransferase